MSEALCHPERPGVYAAGMEGRSRVVPWEHLRACLVRGLPRGSPMGAQKSAEGRRVVAAYPRPEHVNPARWPLVSSADGGAVMGTETPQRLRIEEAAGRSP